MGGLNGKRYNRNTPAEVVMAAQVAPLIEEFMEEWKKERPWGGKGDYGRHEETVYFYGPMEYIADQTGLSSRRISEYKSGRINAMPLEIAEAILMAIDKEYLLSRGDIQVVPNPNWSQERYIEYMRERGCV
jgi:hypothetical protein